MSVESARHFCGVTLYVMIKTPWPTVFKTLQEFVAMNITYARQLAKRLNISAPHAHRICVELVQNKILKSSYKENKRMFTLNYGSLMTRQLLRLSTTAWIQRSRLFKELATICPFGIYGSFAEGRQTANSDLDIWVYISRSEEKKIRQVLNNIEKDFDHPINVIYLDQNKLKKMRETDREFYLRLRLQSLTEWEEVFG